MATKDKGKKTVAKKTRARATAALVGASSKVTAADVFDQFSKLREGGFVTDISLELKLDPNISPDKLKRIADFLKEQKLEATVLGKGARATLEPED